MNLQENFKVIRQLLILSRFDWSFIFSGLYFMVSLFFALNRYDLTLGYISMFLIAMGHLSLNGLYDKTTDSLNERKHSLQNPFAENKAKENSVLKSKHVYIWVSCLWFFALIVNILFIPYNNLIKIIIAILFFGISITFSIIYSKPPLRLKGKPVIDLASTFLVFGFFYPLYSAFITMEINFSSNFLVWTSYIPFEIIIFGTLFNVALLVGMHMPTVLGDLEFDKTAGDRTTAVYLGWEKGSKITVFASLTRTAALTVIVTWLSLTGVLTVNIFLIIPFMLCIPDLYYDFELWKNCDRQSAVNLWKSIIFTSIAGGFSIGYLYFTKNPELLDQYFTPLLKFFLDFFIIF